MNIAKKLALCLLIPSFAFCLTNSGFVGKSGKVIAYRCNGDRFWFKIDTDPTVFYFLQNGRTAGAIVNGTGNGTAYTLTDADKIEIRNAERSAIMQAFSLGETISFGRETTSSWPAAACSPCYEVENISVGAQ